MIQGEALVSGMKIEGKRILHEHITNPNYFN